MINLSLKYRIAGIIFLLEAIMTAVVLGVTISYFVESGSTQLELNEKVLVELIGDLSRIALLTSEFDELQPYIEQIIKDPHINSVFVANANKRVVVSSNVSEVGRLIPNLVGNEHSVWKMWPIENSSDQLGLLGMSFSHKAIEIAKSEVYSLGIMFSLSGMAIIAFVGILIGHLLTRKLEKLSQTARLVADGDWMAKTNFSGSDEVSIVGQTFDKMVDAVGKNIDKLKISKDQLQTAHNELEVRVKERTSELAIAHDKAIEANNSKSLFLANMSHEIRTPLASIIGFAETSLDGEQTALERKDSLKTIVRNSKHLLGIINDILDLSKVEADKIEVEHLEMSPVLLVSELKTLMEHQVKRKNLVFGINYTFPIPSFVISDPLRVKQIILNLLSNSIKFTESGYVYLNVNFDQQKNTLHFNVIDSGIGMTEKQLLDVFNPFTQADVSTTRKYGGTGLGLSLSRQLAEKLGGSISVTSEEGKGSQFSVSLYAGDISKFKLLFSIEDAIDIEKKEDDSIDKVVQISKANTLSGLVLLAEDNPDLQGLISVILKKFGLQVVVVSNGKEAIEKMEEQSFDLICMDIQMPVMGGVDAIIELRKRGYEMPIIALTANTMVEDKEHYIEIGCNDVAAKPIERNDLYNKLSKYLKVNEAPNTISNEPKIISDLLEEEPELVDIVLAFVRRLPESIQVLKNLIKGNRHDELKDIVHQLKGSCASVGFPQLTESMKDIEQALSNDNYSEIENIMSTVDELVAQVRHGEQDYLKMLSENNDLEIKNNIVNLGK